MNSLTLRFNLQTRNLVKFRTTCLTCTARLSTAERHRSREEAFLLAQFVEGTLYQLYLKSPRYKHEYLRSDNRAIERCHSRPFRKQGKLACPKTWSTGVKLTRQIHFLIYSLPPVVLACNEFPADLISMCVLDDLLRDNRRSFNRLQHCYMYLPAADFTANHTIFIDSK